MDSKLILEAARGTLDGTLLFPGVVGQLLAAAGFQFNHRTVLFHGVFTPLCDCCPLLIVIEWKPKNF